MTSRSLRLLHGNFTYLVSWEKKYMWSWKTPTFFGSEISLHANLLQRKFFLTNHTLKFFASEKHRAECGMRFLTDVGKWGKLNSLTRVRKANSRTRTRKANSRTRIPVTMRKQWSGSQNKKFVSLTWEMLLILHIRCFYCLARLLRKFRDPSLTLSIYSCHGNIRSVDWNTHLYFVPLVGEIYTKSSFQHRTFPFLQTSSSRVLGHWRQCENSSESKLGWRRRVRLRIVRRRPIGVSKRTNKRMRIYSQSETAEAVTRLTLHTCSITYSTIDYHVMYVRTNSLPDVYIFECIVSPIYGVSHIRYENSWWFMIRTVAICLVNFPLFSGYWWKLYFPFLLRW